MKKSKSSAPRFLSIFILVLAGSGVFGAASRALAIAASCAQVFPTSLNEKNADYLRALVWGADLPESLGSLTPVSVTLNEGLSGPQRVEKLLRFPLSQLIVAPGHKVLRVSASSPRRAESSRGRLLLNAITSSSGHLRYLDIWDGHHRLLHSFQKGAKDLQTLVDQGDEIFVLVNGKPVGQETPWTHILPAAGSNPSWISLARKLNDREVEVAGTASNYELGSRTTLAKLAENERQASQAKIGIFFGTFDPVHENHIAVAKEVGKEFSLDRVILVPKALPDHKKPSPLGFRQALLMERIKNEGRLDTTLFDTHYFIRNFSKETLVEKIRQDLGANRIYLIDGGDSFKKLLALDQIKPTEVIHYIVNERGENIQLPESLRNKVFVSKVKMNPLSSSEIRHTLAMGQTPDPSKFDLKSAKKVRSWGLYKSGPPQLYRSEELYAFLKSVKPVSDLRIAAGSEAEKQGLISFYNDIWQVLLPAKSKVEAQVAFFTPDTQAFGAEGVRLEANEVAFLLNRLLGMDMVPPTFVGRNIRVGGRIHQKGVLSYAVAETEKLMTETHLNHSLEQKLFFSDARILNVLLQNKGATAEKFLIGRHWATGQKVPLVIGFLKSFTKNEYLAMTSYPVGHREEIIHFRKSTVEALKALNSSRLRGRISELISEQEIQEILRIRDGIVAYIQDLVHKNGHENVLY